MSRRSSPARDRDLDEVWKALGDPTRRSILDSLREGARTTGAVAADFPRLSRFAVMKHLRVLTRAGLVQVKPRGRERWYHLNPVVIYELYSRWISPYETYWAAHLMSVKKASEANGNHEVGPKSSGGNG